MTEVGDFSTTKTDFFQVPVVNSKKNKEINKSNSNNININAND